MTDSMPAPDRGPRVTSMRLIRPIELWPVTVVLAAVACAYLWTLPVEQSANTLRPVTSSFAFDYSAPLPANPVYERDQLAYGDPVFRRLVDDVTVTAEFGFTGPDTRITDASITTRTVVTSTAGWTRVVDESAPAPFDGDETVTSTVVDFAEASALVTDVETATGVQGGITVVVEVTVDATIVMPGDGAEDGLRSVETGRLAFDVTPDVARLVDPVTARASAEPPNGYQPGTAEASGRSGPIAPTVNRPGVQERTQMVSVPAMEQATLSLGIATASVASARLLAVMVMIGSLLIVVVNGLIGRAALRRGDLSVLAVRAGVDVHPILDVPDAVRDRSVMMGSFDALVSAAQAAQSDVLCHSGNDGDEYFVFDGGTVFAHRPAR